MDEADNGGHVECDEPRFLGAPQQCESPWKFLSGAEFLFFSPLYAVRFLCWRFDPEFQTEPIVALATGSQK